MTENTEQKWIRQIQKHWDREAANRLVSRYYREIYAFSYKQIGNMDFAMDLTQDIFIAALQSIRQFDMRKASFRTWLYRIATNKAIDFFRSAEYKSNQRRVSIDTVQIPQDTFPEERYIDAELAENILKALAGLPFEQQQIVRLKVYSDFSFREIATQLAIPEGTAKTRYYAAIKTIREKVNTL